MIEATCAACGTHNRIAEADVPPGAKFVTCSSCKSRIALASQGAKPGAPPPVPGARSATDVTDLPTPKRTGATPPPRPGAAARDADLPAPKRPSGGGQVDLDDLMPTPKGKSGSAEVSDLPAPKARPGTPPPMPKPRTAEISDLPAPKGGIIDLPAPKVGANDGLAPRASSVADLPAPKARPSALADLPTPKGKPVASGLAAASGAEIVDLPTPKAGLSDLPAPKPGGNNDLPAPKGFFDDLPQPAKAARQGIDLPAPKGFFDDLPQPAANKTGLPAPKGFFDDLPQPAQKQTSDEVAPKAAKGGGGFFDDLPEPNVAKGGGSGLFDDLPEAGKMAGSDIMAPEFDAQPAGLELDLGPASAGSPVDARDFTPIGGNDLDMGLAEPSAKGGAHKFNELDMAEPAKGGFKIKTPAADKLSGKNAPLTPIKTTVPPKAEQTLELAEEIRSGPAAAAAKVATKKKADKVGVDVAAQARKKKRVKVVAGAVLGLALVGGGGFYMYQRHAAAKAKADQISEQLATATTALKAKDANHWQRAAAAANAVLELDPHNPQALGIGGEALLAGALDNGLGGPGKIKRGREMVQEAIGAGVIGPEIERAQALAAIAAGQADRAAKKLQAMVAKQPTDPYLQLYLGWALVANGDSAAAIKAFDVATGAEALKVPALYARGNAKLAVADLEGARADYSAAIAIAKDHIPAQIGLAAALPPSQSSQREADELAILARKDIATADPRAVTQAWVIAAGVAREAGRLDVARERYRKALALIPADVGALIGLAGTELKDNKIDLAADLAQKALAVASDNIDALLLQAEILIRQGKLPDASSLATKLAGRQPPLPPLPHARLLVVQARLLEAQGKDDEAADTLVEAAGIAGEIDLQPTMAAVAKLGALAKKAEAKGDPKAQDYRIRASKLLSALAERSQEDAGLAMTLGMAYLESGDPSRAEVLLRRSVDMRATDVEAKLGLAKALAKLGKTDEAIEQLSAAIKADASRVDIALELAMTYELAGRDPEAAGAYEKMLGSKDIPVIARVRAGRFYARLGLVTKAAAQADPILAIEPNNAAGHYLRGEALIATKKLDEARKELTLAVDGDPEAQYLDAQGRAAEASVAQTGDTKYEELALHAYTRASEADPKIFNAWAGQGRIYLTRREPSKAASALNSAIKIKPDDPGVMHDLGIVARDLGQKAVAIQWLEKSNALHPDADTSYELGMLFDDSSNPSYGERMIGALTRATQLGQTEEQNGKTVSWLTDAYYRLGDIEGRLHPNSPAQKRAWESYVGRPHASNEDARLKEVREALRTNLKTVGP